jgi:hypothetical protein
VKVGILDRIPTEDADRGDFAPGDAHSQPRSTDPTLINSHLPPEQTTPASP